jgi:hypothetical protein
MIEFVHTLSRAEYDSGYLNLTDDAGNPRGRDFCLPHREKLVIVDQLGRTTRAQVHHENQIWGSLRNWYSESGIRVGDVVQVRYDPGQRIDGRPVVHLLVLTLGLPLTQVAPYQEYSHPPREEGGVQATPPSPASPTTDVSRARDKRSRRHAASTRSSPSAIHDDIVAIRDGIRTGRFPSEASICQGIVLRLLNSLEWPTYDTQVVAPEYPIEGTRVDFALCHPPGRPAVLVEVKQVGQASGAEWQLFQYAFHKGVPLAVLTDGAEWRFFLPAEQGDYGERQVYKLDLTQREVNEAVARLRRYLGYHAVSSGEAIEAARADYRDAAQMRLVKQTLPRAWASLVTEEDEALIEMLAGRAETLCGYRPEPDLVAEFLHTLSSTGSPPQAHLVPILHPSASRPRGRRRGPAPRPSQPQRPGFTLLGETHSARNARDVLTSVLGLLADRDASFLDRFVSYPRHGRTRRYIARDRNDLYPGRPDLARVYSLELRPGFWVGTNVGRWQIEKILRTASNVAGLDYGRDLIVHLGPGEPAASGSLDDANRTPHPR